MSKRQDPDKRRKPDGQPYTQEELQQYFRDAAARRRKQPAAASGKGAPKGTGLDDPITQRALKIVAGVGIAIAVVTLSLFVYMATLIGNIPSLQQLENPTFQLATVAYTADGEELATYHFENRTWAYHHQISPHVFHALIATEDHRFYDHWGIDVYRTFMAPIRTALGNQQGGSTITQQLARNLYSEVGMEVSPTRKMREWLTAVQLERSYSKQEILVMYLNTVPFRHSAFGIEAAAKTYFNKSAIDLQPEEAAVLIGMLKGNTLYDPSRNPERSRLRRNVVLSQMVKHGFIDRAYFNEHREEPIALDFRPPNVINSFAPYFAEHVRLFLNRWGEQNGYNIYTDGLVVHTTLDSRMQRIAREATDHRGKLLQAVADVEWSDKPRGHSNEQQYLDYLNSSGAVPFANYFRNKRAEVDAFIRETDRYRSMVRAGGNAQATLADLRGNTAFMDSLKAEKTRLELGFVAMDPNNGHVKAWVGGRDFEIDKYDHVSIARRQSGSTFKPFAYTAAIDNGYSPYFMLPDTSPTYRDPVTGQVWQPTNLGGQSGEMMTLHQALAASKNTVTSRLVTDELVTPKNVADYAYRMGIKSKLDEYPSIVLGVSDVTLLEMTAAYSTLASGGIYHEPVVVTRIEDRYGNIIAEFTPQSREALSENTAYAVVDMLRSAVGDGGTGARIRWMFGVNHDVAGKTGTTQESADGWFMLMHPELVAGSWVGFNDRRVSFRSSDWGQGGRTGLHVVGEFFQRLLASPDVKLENKGFPRPSSTFLASLRSGYSSSGSSWERTGLNGARPGGQQAQPEPEKEDQRRRGRIGW